MPITINFPMLQNPPIVIGDISYYNSDYRKFPEIEHFNFEQYKQKTNAGIILRGSVSNAGIDYELEYNLHECQRLSIPVLKLYFYGKVWKNFDGQVDYATEAYNMAKDFSVFTGKAEWDIEENDGLNKDQFTGACYKLTTRLEDKIGVLVGMYTRAYFMNQMSSRNDWMKQRDLHIAHHFTGANPHVVPAYRPYLPDNWADINNPELPTEWQFDTYDGGYDWGSRGEDEIDLNWFVYKGGTYEEYNRYYATVIQPPVITPPAVTDEYMVDPAKCKSLNVRYGPGTDNGAYFAFYSGAKVKVIGESGAWKQVQLLDDLETWVHGYYLKQI